MASISRTLQRIKDDIRPFLPDDAILEACRKAGHQWRNRLLDPVTTVHLFILQILSFNTAMTHLRLLAKYPVQAAAYCKARMRLPLTALQELLRSSSAAMRQARAGQAPAGGLRAFLVDGVGAIMPDTPALQKHFKQPRGQKKGCGFPGSKIMAMVDAFTGMVVEALGFPLYTSEHAKAWVLHPLLTARDLLIGDRGLCSYAHLAMLAARNVQGLFRMHHRQTVSFRPNRRKKRSNKDVGRPTSRFIKRLGKHDQIVEWSKPKTRSEWMTPEQWDSLPPTLRVREVRYWLPYDGRRTECVTIATTLLDATLYPKQEIARLYGLRWSIETHFRELKTTLKMRQFKSQTVEGVQKELAVYCLVYNLVHAVMVEAAQRQGVTPDRISFIDAVRWLLSADPGEELPDLVVNPSRPGRHEPRKIKDRHDKYSLLTRPRSKERKALKKQALAA
jgi:hypothetical protein